VIKMISSLIFQNSLKTMGMSDHAIMAKKILKVIEYCA